MVTSLFLALSAALGLILGSFANVLIHRLPRGESVVAPGSRCPRCGAPIRWYHNVPVLSWLLLRGRCADCGCPISVRYPLVEAAMAGLFLAAAIRWGPTPACGGAWAFLLFCLPLGLIDLEHQILPDRLTYPGIAAGMAFSPLVGWTTPVQSLWGALLGAAIPAAIIGVYALFGIEAMGWGDVKLLAMIGAFLGWHGVLLTLLAGALLGTLMGGLYLAFSGKGRRTPLPFGTFLSAAAMMSLFAGEAVWRWYLGFLAPPGP